MLKGVPRSCHEFYFKCFILGGGKEKKTNPKQFKADCTFYLANVSIPIQQGNEIPSRDPVELGLKAQLVQPHNNLPFISIKLPPHCVPSALIEGCSHCERCLPARLCYIFFSNTGATPQQSTPRPGGLASAKRYLAINTDPLSAPRVRTPRNVRFKSRCCQSGVRLRFRMRSDSEGSAAQSRLSRPASSRPPTTFLFQSRTFPAA